MSNVQFLAIQIQRQLQSVSKSIVHSGTLGRRKLTCSIRDQDAECLPFLGGWRNLGESWRGHSKHEKNSNCRDITDGTWKRDGCPPGLVSGVRNRLVKWHQPLQTCLRRSRCWYIYFLLQSLRLALEQFLCQHTVLPSLKSSFHCKGNTRSVLGNQSLNLHVTHEALWS